jgi:hypothetical protein
VGNNILQEMTPGENYKPAVYETILTYEKDGVQKDFTMQNYPWQDSTWKFVDTKTKLIKEAENAPSILDFKVTDYNGNDLTQTILTYPGHIMLLFIKDIAKANMSHVDKLKALINDCRNAQVPFIALCAASDIETNAFKTKHGLDIQFTTIDGVVCKTAIRSNPGLMWMQGGTVKGKYSYASIPTFKQLALDLSKQQPLLTDVMPEIDSTRSQPQ